MRLATLIMLGVCVLAHGQSNAPQSAHPNTSAMAQHYGHGTPPISPMTDLSNHPFSLEPFAGHSTLLYYWADWCVPCIQDGIPALTSFVKRNPNLSDKYRVVAIRFNSLDEPGDWKAFKAKTENLERTLWHDPPPFPIVYDSSTKMTSDWGIHELPTYALIDPQGNLVRGGNLSMLKSALGVDH